MFSSLVGILSCGLKRLSRFDAFNGSGFRFFHLNWHMGNVLTIQILNNFFSLRLRLEQTQTHSPQSCRFFLNFHSINRQAHRLVFGHLPHGAPFTASCQHLNKESPGNLHFIIVHRGRSCCLFSYVIRLRQVFKRTFTHRNRFRSIND